MQGSQTWNSKKDDKRVWQCDWAKLMEQSATCSAWFWKTFWITFCRGGPPITCIEASDGPGLALLRAWYFGISLDKLLRLSMFISLVFFVGFVLGLVSQILNHMEWWTCASAALHKVTRSNQPVTHGDQVCEWWANPFDIVWLPHDGKMNSWLPTWGFIATANYQLVIRWAVASWELYVNSFLDHS